VTPQSSKLQIVDDDLVRRLTDDEQERAVWLFLEPHLDFDSHWYVSAFDTAFYLDLHEDVGPYKVISPNNLGAFLGHCQELGYRVAFFEDPATILDTYEGLNDAPEVSVESDMPGTVKGLFPYQVQGFNFLKEKSGAVAMWSTGTGKTVLASALLKYRLDRKDFDTAWFVVRSHNKVNTQRTLKRLTGIDSIIIDGDKRKRKKLYEQMSESDEPVVVITNYEKFRVDEELLIPLFEGRVFCIWDEMPTKLKTRTTKLYKSVCSCLYTCKTPQVNAERVRPESLYQLMLSATPIENDPEDWFNCVRLLDPTVYGTVKDFRNEFVASYNWFDRSKPEVWHRLDKMGLMASSICHQVDKTDPDIASQFPEVIETPVYIDWDETDRKIYDKFAQEVAKADDDEINVLAAIGVMQMLCDAPTMVNNSAARRQAFEEAYEAFLEEGGKMPTVTGSEAAMRLLTALGGKLTDERHSKLETLRQLIVEDHPNEKIVVFSAFNDGLMPILEAKLTEWEVSYVRYNGSPDEKQAAHDAFSADPDIQVFLSSDAGSDSINLEQASVVIHYDLPWKWSTLIQRQNRIHRVTSGFQTVTFYTLLMANSVEDRKLALVNRKLGYHEGTFKGAIADQSASARMTKDDLLYILTG